MTLNGLGSPTAWITVDAYGSGSAPKIIRDGNAADRGVRMNNPSYWAVSNLEVGDAGTGILVYYDSVNHQGVHFSHIYVHDIHGISFGNTVDSRQDSIFDSAGIEFTASVTVTAAQYVVQNVALSYIEGTHNQDSIAFDWDNGQGLHVPDGTRPIYAAQDVTLQNLALHDDDAGGAESGYACPEGFRLSYMSNVRVINSVLNNEAACSTGSGTAAILVGAVKDVALVNSIVVNVPATHSADKTGIDYETLTDQVRIQNSYIASNAGPGLSLQAIHPPNAGRHDYSINSDISDNIFALNGGGGIRLLGDNNVPTGVIRDNFYYEPAGFLTTGCPYYCGDLSALTVTNNMAPSSPLDLYNAAHDFSGIQGQRGWSYQYSGDDGATWTNLAFDAPTQTWQQPGLTATLVTQFEQRPATCAMCLISRVWTAPAAGTISIRGRALGSDMRSGGSFVASVMDNNTTVWGPEIMSYAAPAGSESNRDSIAVAPGDVLRFVVANDGSGNQSSLVSWDPSVGYVAAPTSTPTATITPAPSPTSPPPSAPPTSVATNTTATNTPVLPTAAATDTPTAPKAATATPPIPPTPMATTATAATPPIPPTPMATATATNTPISIPPTSTSTSVTSVSAIGSPTSLPRLTAPPTRRPGSSTSRSAKGCTQQHPLLAPLVASRYVTSGTTLTVGLRTDRHLPYVIILTVDSPTVTYYGRGKHRRRIVHERTLYRLKMTGETSARGRAEVHLSVAYNPVKAVGATLMVEVRSDCVSTSRRIRITIGSRVHRRSPTPASRSADMLTLYDRDWESTMVDELF